MAKVSTSLVAPAITLVIGIFLGILGHALYSSPANSAMAAAEPIDGTDTEGPAAFAVEDASLGKEPSDVPAAPIEARRAEVALPAGPDPDLGVLVYGRVFDDEGAPVESAYIHFSSAVPGKQAISEAVKNGGYATHGLTPGQWQVLVRGDGLIEASRTVDIAADPVVRRDFVVNRAYLVTVRVQTPEGQPLQQAMIAAKRMDFIHTELNAIGTRTPLESVPMTALRYHRSFGIGRWSAARSSNRSKEMSDDANVLGLLELDSPPPAYVSLMLKHHIVASQELLPGQKEVTFVVGLDEIEAKTVNVRVKVIDRSTGMPIENARVSITDRQTGGGGRPTGADGTILLEHQATGLMEMVIWAQDYERYLIKLRLQPGELDLGTIELGPPVKAHVLVVDAAGQPQAATLSWTNLDRRSFPQPLIYSRLAKSNSKGTGELYLLGRGRYLLQARVRGKSLATRIINTDGLSDEPIRLVLEPTHPVVLDNTGMSRRRIFTAMIRDAQGRLVYARYLRVPVRYETRLSVGNYAFEIYEALERVQSGNCTVVEGSPTTIRITG